MILAERLTKLLPGGKVVVELWCDPNLPSDKEACELMRAQAAALRQIADGLEAFAQPGLPVKGGEA